MANASAPCRWVGHGGNNDSRPSLGKQIRAMSEYSCAAALLPAALKRKTWGNTNEFDKPWATGNNKNNNTTNNNNNKDNNNKINK